MSGCGPLWREVGGLLPRADRNALLALWGSKTGGLAPFLLPGLSEPRGCLLSACSAAPNGLAYGAWERTSHRPNGARPPLPRQRSSLT